MSHISKDKAMNHPRYSCKILIESIYTTSNYSPEKETHSKKVITSKVCGGGGSEHISPPPKKKQKKSIIEYIIMGFVYAIKCLRLSN